MAPAVTDAQSAEVQLAHDGFCHVHGPFATVAGAHSAAAGLCRRARSGSLRGLELPAVEVIGDFVIPPRGAGTSRDFQALHFDFGLPLDPRGARDLAHFTALYIPLEFGQVQAQTRLVRLDDLLRQRRWADMDELTRRFASYGVSHGTWDPRLGYSEGILGRLVEAADGRAPTLPSVSATPGFLCGMEFASADDERRFFDERGLRIEEAEIRVRLRSGELLVFDNLVLAHGRRGRRRPGELHQRIFGYRALSPTRQRAVRDRVLRAFRS